MIESSNPSPRVAFRICARGAEASERASDSTGRVAPVSERLEASTTDPPLWASWIRNDRLPRLLSPLLFRRAGPLLARAWRLLATVGVAPGAERWRVQSSGIRPALGSFVASFSDLCLPLFFSFIFFEGRENRPKGEDELRTLHVVGFDSVFLF